MEKSVYILSAVRTPIGSFGGALSTLSATTLGSMVTKAAVERARISSEPIDELLFGNVLSAGLGQAPATQVTIGAGLGDRIPSTLINKVCASGMKSIMAGAQAILSGNAHVVVAGGMESMSNVPYYLPKARTGYRYGNGELQDGLVNDALTDAYDHCAMGVCADNTAQERQLSRQAQDDYALASYARAAAAWSAGKFNDEVITVEVKGRKGEVTVVREDEEYKNLVAGKVPGLRPAFTEKGTVTAANASKLSDGAAAVVLVSEDFLQKTGAQPLAKIRGFADAAQAPMWFTTAPAQAIPKALRLAGLSPSQIGCYEINEAFSAVALANMQELGLDAALVNMRGGAVALGHPLGASGCRIVVTMAHLMRQESIQYGVAGICNGGGGASALVLERCS